MIALGKSIPDFQLKDIRGKTHGPKDALGTILVLVFWSAECPWSLRADELIDTWRKEWGGDVDVWMIASNANEGEQQVATVARERELEMVLFDPDHKLADLLGAVTTPHCYVIDREGKLRYRGGLDDINFRQREATRFYLKDAVASVLSEEPVKVPDTPGYGCTIVRMGLTSI